MARIAVTQALTGPGGGDAGAGFFDGAVFPGPLKAAQTPPLF